MKDIHLAMIEESLGTMGTKLCYIIIELAKKAHAYDAIMAEKTKETVSDEK